MISINELLISIIPLLISINELLISINTVDDEVFIDINNSFIDINNWQLIASLLTRGSQSINLGQCESSDLWTLPLLKCDWQAESREIDISAPDGSSRSGISLRRQYVMFLVLHPEITQHVQ